MLNSEYKDLKKFSDSIRISAERLVQAFEIEKEFHHKILNEPSPQKRKKLYEDVYKTVHKIYGKTESDINKLPNPKDKLVRRFKKELENKAVLDVGCGEGYFLASISRQFHSKDITGIDVSIPSLSIQRKDINFVESDIIDFNLEKKFDVVFADQVVEHIAPSDLPTFLNSVKKALARRGKFIFLTPNRLFGPSDVTRIKDFSYSGKTAAEGTHLNELTYTDIIPILLSNGFTNLKTILPLPKIKSLFPNFRLNPTLLKYIENSRLLMWIIYNLKYKGFPLLKFETIIICSVD